MDHGLGAGEHACLLVLEDVGAVNAFPLKVASDLGVQEHLDQNTVCHDELRDQVYVPVSVVSECLGRFSAWSELVPEVGEVEGGSLSSVVPVAVQVKDLLPLGGEES